MLGGRSKRHGERLGEFAYRARAAGKPAQHGTAGRIGQRAEHAIEAAGGLFNHVVGSNSDAPQCSTIKLNVQMMPTPQKRPDAGNCPEKGAFLKRGRKTTFRKEED